MREIKFRIWIKDVDIMMYSLHYIYQETGKLYFLHKNDKGELELFEFNDEPILMQYTGFKDQNGKPIYEGDIIEFDKKEWGGDDNIHVVEWDDENGAWSWGGGLTSDMCYRTVIGNIYENKSLLNE